MTISPEDLVRREVHYCASSLVSTLANGAYALPSKRHGLTDGADDLGALAEQAAELAAPIADWEEAAQDCGAIIFHADDEWEWRFIDSSTEDIVDSGSGYSTREAAARAACDAKEEEPYQREVFEHWIVSDWLADKLAEKGEKVDKDFAGLTVWARTTTGQGIASDSVIEEITRDLNAA